MSYVVTESCIRCKYMDCVDICPVECFHEGPNMLVIDPDVCIDCALCQPLCPVDAIQPDTESDMAKWVSFNRSWASKWPQIKEKKTPPPDADDWASIPQKMDQFRSN